MTGTQGGWLWPPVAGATLLQVSVASARPTTSYAAIELGADGFGIGLLAAAQAVPSMLAAVWLGRAAATSRSLGVVPSVS